MQVHFCKASLNLRITINTVLKEKEMKLVIIFFISTNRVLQTTTNLLSQWHLKSFYFCVYQHRRSQSLSLHHRACYNMSSLYFHLSLFLHNKTPTSTNNNRQTVKKCSLFVDRGKDLRLIVIEIRRENHEFAS